MFFVLMVILFSSFVNSAPSRARVGLDISADGGTGYSAQKLNNYVCGVDQIITYGGSTDLWGTTWSVDDFSDENFRVRLDYVTNLGDDPEMDHIEVNVYYMLPIPEITLIAPTPANNSQIGSTLRINATTGYDLTECKVEHNATGIWENTSLTISGMNCSGAVNTAPTNNSFYNFRVWADAGSGENSSETRTVNVTTNSPNVTLNYPANDSAIAGTTTLLNYTLLDIDGDLMDIEIFASSNNSNLSEFSLFRDKLLANGTHTYNFSFTPSVYPDGLIALYHFDNQSEFGENDTHVVDFVAGRNNGTHNTLSHNYNLLGKFGNAIGGFTRGVPSEKIDIGNGSDITQLCEGSGCSFSFWTNVSDLSNEEEGVISRYNSTARFFKITKRANVFSYQMDFDVWEFGNDASNCLARTTDLVSLQSEWVHFVMVYSNETNQTHIYVNGVLNDSTNCDYDGINTTVWRENTRHAIMGRLYEVSSVAYENDFDELAVFNTALNQTEIDRMYNLQDGKYDWKVEVTDSTYEWQSDVWQFSVGDSCTPPDSGNWNAPDSCTIEEDIEVQGNLTLGGNCDFTINANITFVLPNSYVFLGPEPCKIEVLSGGFNG